jgi:predicted nucleic acid-binding protein
VPVFVDTNVLLYSVDASQVEKQPLATAWVGSLWERRDGRISCQVLSEFYVNVTRKLRPGINDADARAMIRDLNAWRPVAIDPATIEDAWAISDRYGFAHWDALIVASARSASCDILLTEDLQDGQDLDGITVVNPFRMRPDDRFR